MGGGGGGVAAIQRFSYKGVVLIVALQGNMSAIRRCPLFGGVRYSEVSAIQHVRYSEVLLYNLKVFPLSHAGHVTNDL